MTHPKKGRNLTHSIVETLGQSIASGAYKNKPFPIEADLCAQFGASRSVVREAIKMLTAKGLIGSRARQGTWVQGEQHWNFLDKDVLSWLLQSEVSYGLMIEFIEYRKVIEPEAAALAALNTNPADLEDIRTALAQMQAAEAGKADPLQSDINFHVAILNATNNRFIMQNKELVETVLQYAIKLTNKTKGVQSAELNAHKAIADAIFAGDAKLARTTTLALLNEAQSLLENAASKHPPAPT